MQHEEDSEEDEEKKPLIKPEKVGSFMSSSSSKSLFTEIARFTKLYYYEKDLERLKNMTHYCKHEIIIEY